MEVADVDSLLSMDLVYCFCDWVMRLLLEWVNPISNLEIVNNRFFTHCIHLAIVLLCGKSSLV